MNKNLTVLHLGYKLPGDIYCPPLVDIAQSKISLVNELINLSNNLKPGVSSKPGRSINEMIEIELQAIYDIISLDKYN